MDAHIMKLIVPTLSLRESFLSMARDLEAQGHWGWYPSPSELERTFPAFLDRLTKAERGVVSDPQEVPSTQRWMVVGNEVVGRIGVRHDLNDELRLRGGHIGYAVMRAHQRKGYGTHALAQALPIARALGLAHVLITCDDDNVGSIRVIEANGGVLRDTIVVPERTVPTRRYDIALS